MDMAIYSMAVSYTHLDVYKRQDIADIKDMVGDKRFAGMCSDSIESCAESHMRST